MSRESGDLRPELARAVADYALFVERGYPVKGVLKLVGDRHRLSGVERNILYRGVVSTALAERRTRRRLALPHELPRRSTLIVDGHNVIFTLVNYLQGRTAFLAVDGFLRDAGNPARRIRAGEEFGRAVEEIGRRLRSLEPARVVVYFDEPVTYSKDHIARARRAWAEVAPAVELHLVPSADQALKGSPEGVLLTSDSTLIDATSLPVADLPRWIIEDGFGARPARLAEWAGIHTDSRREGD